MSDSKKAPEFDLATKPPPASAPREEVKDWYDSLANQIAREDNIVSQRLTWLMTFEGLLFASFGLSASGKETDIPTAPQALRAALVVLPVVGTLAAATAAIGIEMARGAGQELVNLYKNWRKADPRVAYFVRPFGTQPEADTGWFRKRFMWLNFFDTARAFPWLVIVSWIVLGLFSCKSVCKIR